MPAAADLPEPSQVAPERPARPLDPQELDRVVAAVLADPSLATAVGLGDVVRVEVRATAPAGGAGAQVVLWFAAPVLPAVQPWEVLCDIGGQTSTWDGVAARVDLRTGSAEGSPVWPGGVNCLGLRLADPDAGEGSRSTS